MNTFQQSISMRNTEIKGQSEKHNLQHDLKENKKFCQTIGPEISSNYQMHLFKEILKDHIKSEIEGCICALNSSVELKKIGLVGSECGNVVRVRRGSVVVVKGCAVGIENGNEAGAFNLCGCIGILRNITLKGWGRGGEIYSGKLFGGSDEGEGSISVSESRFSSFCVSSAPFLSSSSIPLVTLSHLTFFNISTANDVCSPSTIMSTQTSCFMSSCSFSSVCDTYDGGIVHSLNNPLASLSVSNSSFVGCCRTRNIEFIGTAEAPLKPGRQNETENGTNSFTWCEWNGSKTIGSCDSWNDGVSSGGAICMFSQSNASVSVFHCYFNNCNACYAGGGVHFNNLKSIEVVNNSFKTCTAQNYRGGGMFILKITLCVQISGCEFQNCKGRECGGGLLLNSFDVSGTNCIGEENVEGESACVFDCCFSSCSITSTWGGGAYFIGVPNQFKIRNIQFISCTAKSSGGGFYLELNKATEHNDFIYCYYLFFHGCKCSDNVPNGHDMIFVDYNNVYLNSGIPFFECFTTNTDDKRICYAFNFANASAWAYDQTSKKNWLKDKTIYVSVKGNDSSPLCGANETFPCLTVKKAFEMCEVQISLAITLMEGNHQSEATTINIGTKKISVIGKGKDKSSIGTGVLSSPSTAGALFSVSTGHLGLLHMKVDCNSIVETSPSVVVVSDGSGSLSFEDIVITTSVSSGNYVMSSSVFVLPLSQLSMADVEIMNMNISESLFSEPDQS
ncbi:uncharacterized protein MONOS_13217 [Monocercomonoides exilis]|uniref:uncharacterized protein n=1 Tax=Monocercomonoides exilis TaxID=2049356 RepID=UPI00355A5CE1|nr:hypothetical protein MONOS_13217 [Monocercomonoides exilis]|eukprot:MONOS_13217.1-p1 / transcript=MONOS_13217.1 / gene=MONOS_13217 / organism=Monocercomonoides_exilis_PA203 / gene_product=unspecified product / transcript_product=unspecified product / location=Mono_scaffold00792:24383-26581(-) / protein_length=733 / sequence_SO=supercontig / SO=protein_coding / is_pseudo=false